jgi:hypothetical protein
MSERDSMNCAELTDVAAELALGVLTGRERAIAVAHLDECDACREHVRQLATTGEGLVGLLPSLEPPPGFETRVLTRLGLAVPATRPTSRLRPGLLGRRGHHRHSRRGRTGDDGTRPPGGTRQGTARGSRAARTLAAAAFTLAVAAAGLLGWGLRGATTTAAPPLRTAALLTSAHREVGQIFYYDGAAQWMYVYVAMGAPSTTVRCQLQTADGRVTTIATFRLTNGYGAWGIPAPPETSGPSTVRLVTPAGQVLASASLPA